MHQELDALWESMQPTLLKSARLLRSHKREEMAQKRVEAAKAREEEEQRRKRNQKVRIGGRVRVR